jgi:hypothetical protein
VEFRKEKVDMDTRAALMGGQKRPCQRVTHTGGSIIDDHDTYWYVWQLYCENFQQGIWQILLTTDTFLMRSFLRRYSWAKHGDISSYPLLCRVLP